MFSFGMSGLESGLRNSFACNLSNYRPPSQLLELWPGRDVALNDFDDPGGPFDQV